MKTKIIALLASAAIGMAFIQGPKEEKSLPQVKKILLQTGLLSLMGRPLQVGPSTVEAP
jgi:hypothetical protein